MYRQQDSQLNSISSPQHILEFYLFVNPLGHKCYNIEKDILEFIHSSSQYKVHFRFITFHNFNTVNEFIDRLKLPKNDLTLRNFIYSAIYDACLGYKAALMQGKKKGRAFLMNLQYTLSENPMIYSKELVIEVAKKSKLDIEMFLEDKASDYVKNSYEADQQIAIEMQIRRNPTLVIFDNRNFQYGLLIENEISYDILEEIFQNQRDESAAAQPLLEKKNIKPIGMDYLRIIK